ncbi:hypothetical protein BJY01DRAFT_246589 [Aspergillus pseudoustus]|uniref:Carboxylesterase type B domain-containing protein n=1 Tax=Aspergillus pseudoustus TaxID=1810923 RepID=A0ABR4K687_9EURO
MKPTTLGIAFISYALAAEHILYPRQGDFMVPTVNTTSGIVSGHPAPNTTGVSEYLGIPFAQPPLGELIFAPPQPYKGNGYINGTKYGFTCPATSSPPVEATGNITVPGANILTIIGQSELRLSENCLTLSRLESTKPSPPPGPNSNFAIISLLAYCQLSQLRTSMPCAWAVETLRYMYDGLDTFENRESTHLAQNLTASRPGKILGPGAVPPHIAATMFSNWAIRCMILAVRYGVQAEKLDGYSFLRFGVDIAGDELRNSGSVPARLATSNNKELHQHDELLDTPGLVGDSRVHMKVGHIGLVKEGCYARRDELSQ